MDYPSDEQAAKEPASISPSAQGDSVLATPDHVPLPPWGMYDVAVSLLSGFILLPMLVSNALTLAAPLLSPVHQIFMTQAVTLLSWVLIFGVLAWRYQINIWPYLGVRFTRPVSYYLRETVRVLLVMLALMALLNLLVSVTGVSPAQPYSRYSHAEIRMISLFAVLTAPFMEEMVFRGFVQSTFHKVSPPVRTVVFTCLVFVLFHAGYYQHVYALAYVFLLGLVLGYWRERTQSVVPGMLAHFINNLLASLVMFFGAGSGG